MKDIFIDDVLAVLPADLTQVIEATHSHKGFDKEHILTTALAVINFAAQRTHNVNPVRFSPKPLSEFFIILQERSGGKSSLWSDFLSPIEKNIQDLSVRYAKELEFYDYEMALYNKALKKADDNSIIPSKPKKPNKYNPFVQNPTLNGIIKHLEHTSVAGVFTQEGAMLLNSHDTRGDSSSISFTTGLAMLWSAEPLQKQTGLEEVYLPGRRCNMLVMVQKDLASDLFSKNNKVQGLFSRFLLVDHKKWIRRTEDEADATRQEYNQKMTVFQQKLQTMLNKSVKTQGFDNKELILEEITFSACAEPHRKSYSNLITEQINNTPDHEKGLEIEMLGKIYEHACRLAGTIAVYSGKNQIGVDEWMAGVMLAQFYQTNLKYLVEPLNGDEHIVNTAEDTVIEWIKKNRKKGDQISMRDLKMNIRILRKLTGSQIDELFKNLELEKLIKTSLGAKGGIIVEIL